MVAFKMSEDEFVVLLEHAGILETSDENDMEFMEETVLREWLEREGVELFTTQVVAKREGVDTDGELAVEGVTPVASAATLVGEARTRMAGHILARLLERGWIAPINFDYDEDETEEWKTKLYTPRLRTSEAYRIYIEKDPGRPDDDQKARLREKMWQDCFPTCSESAKQTFLSFKRPEIILHATLGLNLISNGISSVPAFSRELKSMGVSSADDRSIIVGFLAKAFPCE
ncbi:hypothetical protein BBJ28_00016709 [Nothophytophthora sp. Chile5]|nr:hypothetical protein BBJ28_00016709 [Nothophytophthora sp. Chile5]